MTIIYQVTILHLRGISYIRCDSSQFAIASRLLFVGFVNMLTDLDRLCFEVHYLSLIFVVLHLQLWWEQIALRVLHVFVVRPG